MHSATLFPFIGALLGLTAILTGTFGSHLLKDKLSPEALATYEIAVRYQFYHAFTLLAIQQTLYSGWAFVLGTLIFSGSLYLLTLTGIKRFGAITPIGGVTLLIAWTLLAVDLYRRMKS